MSEKAEMQVDDPPQRKEPTRKELKDLPDFKPDPAALEAETTRLREKWSVLDEGDTNSYDPSLEAKMILLGQQWDRLAEEMPEEEDPWSHVDETGMKYCECHAYAQPLKLTHPNATLACSPDRPAWYVR
jgi:hypothetical protein